jgi:drug/metabolite transporter (DMT)-like permease
VSNGTLLPVWLGLAAAIVWGAGDFTGGLATKRANVYGVVIGGEVVGLVVLLALAFLTGERVPPAKNLIQAGLAGVWGGFGLILLYRALAGGQMSVAAPISAVLAAAIPVLVNAFWQGLPDPLVLAGMLLALVAIGLIARGEGGASSARLRLEHIRLPLAAGVVFGLFFVFLHQASQETVFWPIIATRTASIIFLVGFATLARQPWRPQRAVWPMLVLLGLLDTGGNGLYVLSGQLGRLDVAAVLSSLYPASTVALAWLVLKERIARPQIVGILSALVAIVLITL